MWRRNETQRSGTSHGGGCRHDSSLHLTTLTSAFSSAQLFADGAGKGKTARKEGRQGQVEEDLQIGHNPQESIINKAASTGSPLKGH